MEENNIATVPASSVLTWGILSVALCWVPVLGLIFAIIARKKAKAFALENGACTGKAKVGQILSIFGLIGAIIMTVYWAIIIFGLISLGTASYYY